MITVTGSHRDVKRRIIIHHSSVRLFARPAQKAVSVRLSLSLSLSLFFFFMNGAEEKKKKKNRPVKSKLF